MAKTAPSAQNVLAAHAGSKDTLEFKSEIKSHGIRFFPGMIVKFEDAAVAAYFDVAFNDTEFTTKKANVTIGSDEINFDADAPGATIDPNTVIGRGRSGIETGTTVIGHLNGNGPVADGTVQADDANASAEG